MDDVRTAGNTQWPRFQVFVQERDDLPYQDYGSVHAPDSELALFNARDVFARRPECVSMWVVPVEAIFARTRQELESWSAPAEPAGLPHKRFSVFCKQRTAGTQTYAGEVQAGSLQAAVQAALNRYGGAQAAFVWWIVPSDAGLKSQPDDVESLYAPAHDKLFRMSTDFHTLSAMRAIRKDSQGEG